MSAALPSFVTALVLAGGAAHAQDEADDMFESTTRIRNLELDEVPKTLDAADALASMNRSLDYLVREQGENGAWATPVLENVWEAGFSVETYYAWQMASQALAVEALLDCPETPERRRALERGLEWLCTTRMPRRGSDWDIDHVWTQLLAVAALTQAATDPRFAEEPWKTRIDERGRAFYSMLEAHQAPEGGWAYYDNPPLTRPSWSTSFCTALILPGLLQAADLGWGDDRRVFDRALRYVKGCALPDGAYSYSLTPVPRINGGESINRIKGSLGRTQVCNWGRALAGDPRITTDVVREGLDAFFKDHEFLDIARMRPIPHEAYYANAAYFYLFAHVYAARCINLLPPEEREAYHAKLRPHLTKIQYANGASTDFLATGYLVIAGTAYSAMALSAGLGAPEK